MWRRENVGEEMGKGGGRCGNRGMGRTWGRNEIGRGRCGNRGSGRRGEERVWGKRIGKKLRWGEGGVEGVMWRKKWE
jgi:hypothetical protein